MAVRRWQVSWSGLDVPGVQRQNWRYFRRVSAERKFMLLTEAWRTPRVVIFDLKKPKIIKERPAL